MCQREVMKPDDKTPFKRKPNKDKNEKKTFSE